MTGGAPFAGMVSVRPANLTHFSNDVNHLSLQGGDFVGRKAGLAESGGEGVAAADELATAEGFVGDDEKTWASRNEFARRAMAQTRAISRACRSAFAFVVVMMDAGLETTPAEEMGELLEKPKVEYRPKPAPANLERRAPKAEAGEAFIKAIDAAGKAENLDALDVVRRKVDGSYHADRLTDDEYRDVLGALEARKASLVSGGAQ